VTSNISILGSGKIGTALARRFAAKGMPVGIANRQSPEILSALVRELGQMVVPPNVADSLGADAVVLAIPFSWQSGR
jgi:8-hydroxy-5-deazaflavin:NADPH oxidoreductase